MTEEREQLRQIVTSLALHIGCLAVFIRDKGLRESSERLAQSAINYLEATKDNDAKRK